MGERVERAMVIGGQVCLGGFVVLMGALIVRVAYLLLFGCDVAPMLCR